MTRALAVLALAALLAPGAALAQGPDPVAPEPRTNLADIEDEVICLVCGTTLELAENAPQAERVREQIRGLIAEGLTKDEIKDELVAEYGENVLSTPDTKGFDLTAWVLPGAAMVLAAVGIGVTLWRRRRRGGGGEAPPPLAPADASRVESDLRSYDL